jgi:hypothetical protein
MRPGISFHMEMKMKVCIQKVHFMQRVLDDNDYKSCLYGVDQPSIISLIPFTHPQEIFCPRPDSTSRHYGT